MASTISPPAPSKRYVSDKVVADIWGCSRTTVWRRTKDGTLTPIRMGSLTRFDLDEVYAAGRTRAVPGEPA